MVPFPSIIDHNLHKIFSSLSNLLQNTMRIPYPFLIFTLSWSIPLSILSLLIYSDTNHILNFTLFFSFGFSTLITSKLVIRTFSIFDTINTSFYFDNIDFYKNMSSILNQNVAFIIIRSIYLPFIILMSLFYYFVIDKSSGDITFFNVIFFISSAFLLLTYFLSIGPIIPSSHKFKSHSL